MNENSNLKKRIALVVIIVVIIGAIWYLESMKVHPTGSGAPAQAINVGADDSNATSSSSTTVTAVAGASTTASGVKTLHQIAATDEAANDQPAIEIANPTGFVNASSSFKLADSVGKKVILLDFWTYSCINCIRTLPYLTAWDAKYRNAGLEVVGIHTPEFDFEKDINNVQAAVQKYGIHYPVVLDSNYGTWQAYGNLYWPHEYLIDIAGYIVHDQVGEGSYDETEQKIQQLLKQAAPITGRDPNSVPTGLVSVTAANLNGINSGETYFGAARNDPLANGTAGVAGTQTLTEPTDINLNYLYLTGTWNFQQELATNVSTGAKVIFKYNSGKVFFVAAASSTVQVEVMQDGKPLSAADSGSDVVNGKMMIQGSRLYNVVSNHDGSGTHTLEFIIDSPGLQAYTFTFG